jgi:glycosyltransferase involved in cell wall biosynthesis
MNILLINKYHYYRAGPETVYLKSSELLKKHGHKVVFFSMDHPENLPCETTEYFVPYVELTVQHSILNQLRIAGRILYSFKARKNLSRLLDRYPIDIAHLHDICFHISPSILHELKQRGIPIVMTLHDLKMVCTSYYMFTDKKICEACCGEKYYVAMMKKCVKDSLAKSAIAASEMYLHHKILDIYNNVDIFISPSLFLKKKLEDSGFNKKIVHVYNFFYLHKEEADVEKDVKDDKKNTVAYIGRLSPEKGLITLLKAAKLLMNKGKKVQFNIIGDGPLMNKLQEKVRADQINNIRFLGYMKHKELYQEVRKSIAVVIPSEWYENNPMSVIEAFALGRPVIGSRLGGIPELVKDYERGLTFEPRNPEDLYLKIKFLVDNPDKSEMMGEKAKLFVEKELSPEKHYYRLMKIYNNILELHKKGL